MLTATGLEVRAGSRLLLDAATFRIAAGDRVGLVGRNGAGKTTLCRILAGEGAPAAGTVDRTNSVGYLPQDPRTGDLDTIARDRVLSARGIDQLLRDMEKAQIELGERPDDDALIRRYGRLEEQFTALGGYSAEAEAERICSNLGLPDRVLDQPLRTLSGGQRRRIELARILFSDARTLLLDVVISHDVDLLERVVNRVFHLDANRSAIDLYNVGWKAYLQQREVDERRRKRERVNAEKKAASLIQQADRMRAKATKAVAAQNMARRAERLLSGLEDERKSDRVARIRFPDPAPCGRVPLTATELSKSYGSLEVFTDVDLAIDRGSRVVVLGLNGAGKTTLLRILAGIEPPDTGEVHPGHGLVLGYYAQEHETLDAETTVLANLAAVASQLPEVEQRKVLGSFNFTGDAVLQLAGTLSGGEKTRLALARLVVSSANVLLLDEPTNNLDPASREQVLNALRTYKGAIVLVTHDEGAVDALQPERVLLLPDGVEDHWSADLADLVALA
jgi:ATPase subunit of ABC transporter with duplicated ATPase domains